MCYSNYKDKGQLNSIRGQNFIHSISLRDNDDYQSFNNRKRIIKSERIQLLLSYIHYITAFSSALYFMTAAIALVFLVFILTGHVANVLINPFIIACSVVLFYINLYNKWLVAEEQVALHKLLKKEQQYAFYEHLGNNLQNSIDIINTQNKQADKNNI